MRRPNCLFPHGTSPLLTESFNNYIVVCQSFCVSSIPTPLHPICSLLSTTYLPPSNKGDLEYSSITTTVGLYSLTWTHLQIISYALTTFHKHNIFILYGISCFKHISLYAFMFSQYPRNTHLTPLWSSLPLFSSGLLHMQGFQIYACVQCRASSHSTFL